MLWDHLTTSSRPETKGRASRQIVPPRCGRGQPAVFMLRTEVTEAVLPQVIYRQAPEAVLRTALSSESLSSKIECVASTI